jgi:hypothetical protein
LNWLTAASEARLDSLEQELSEPLFDDCAREEQYRRIRDRSPACRIARNPWRLRLPLLYRPLVEFMLAIPWSQKIAPRQDRVLQRRSLRGAVPEMIRVRTDKRGPTASLVLGFAQGWQGAARLGAAKNLEERGIVQGSILAGHLERLRHGVIEDQMHFLFATIALEAWLELDLRLRTRDEPLFATEAEPFLTSMPAAR